MNEQTKSPIGLMADTLAEMAERVVEAERQRDEAEKSASNWYENWLVKEAQLQETKNKLEAEIEEHQKTKQKCRDLLEKLQREAGMNE